MQVRPGHPHLSHGLVQQHATSACVCPGGASFTIGEVLCKPGSTLQCALPESMGAGHLTLTAKEDLGEHLFASCCASVILLLRNRHV